MTIKSSLLIFYSLRIYTFESSIRTSHFRSLISIILTLRITHCRKCFISKVGHTTSSSHVLFCTAAYLLLRTLFSEYSPSISTSSRNFRDRYAYATFLSPGKRPSSSSPSRSTSYSDPDSNSDPNPYFTSVRLLTYQLLHDPRTRTRLQPSIPFLVLTLPSVPVSQLSILVSEGATIVPIQPLNLSQTFDQSIIARFRDVLAKLRLWQLTQYDKILALDADSIILSPLDSIFADPDLSTPMATLHNGSTVDAPEAHLPSSYLLSASADTWGNQADWIGSERLAYLCACFMLLAPSDALFAYYEWVLGRPEPSFHASFPDQDLLIYAHRPEGSMPWRKIPAEWSANDGDVVDELRVGAGGVKSLHVKAWEGADGGNVGNERVKSFWKGLVGEMDAYYIGLRAM